LATIVHALSYLPVWIEVLGSVPVSSAVEFDRSRMIVICNDLQKISDSSA
jgi:hypothetical protein